MFGRQNKTAAIITVGSEAKVNGGVIRLFKDGDVGGYVVWYIPTNAKGLYLRSGWQKRYHGTLLECRRYIKQYQ